MRALVVGMLLLMAMAIFVVSQADQQLVAEETSQQALADAAAIGAYAELLQPRPPAPPANETRRPVMAVSLPLQYAPPYRPVPTKPQREECGPGGCAKPQSSTRTTYSRRGMKRARRNR